MSPRGYSSYLSLSVDPGQPGRLKWILGLPSRLVRTVHWNRIRTPAPWLYVAGAVAGASLGAAVVLLTSGPWWLLVSAGLVAGAAVVWLVFAASAMTSARARGRLFSELRREIAGTFDPQGVVQRESQDYVERFHATSLPLYGLAQEWTGERSLGASAWGSGGEESSESLGLSHRREAGPSTVTLDVEVHSGTVDLAQFTEELCWQTQDYARPEYPMDLLRPAAPEDFDSSADPAVPVDLTRDTITILVDGEPHEFAQIAKGEHRWALRAFDHYTVMVKGEQHPLDGLHLVRVTDLTPYEQGTHEQGAYEPRTGQPDA